MITLKQIKELEKVIKKTQETNFYVPKHGAMEEFLVAMGKNGAELLASYRRAIEVIQFYAAEEHFEYAPAHSEEEECPQESDPETVSGEPINFLCGHGDFTYEDGSIAREFLKEVEGE